MVRDSKTRTGARAPEVERHASLAWRCSTEQVASDLERRTHAAAESTKDGCKPDPVTSMLGASLIEAGSGKAYLIGQLWSRTGVNPPYGILGGSRKRRHHSKPGPRLDPTRQFTLQ
jgi:hypothetical protein